MINSENIDAFISIALGLYISFMGYRRSKNPLAPRPGEMAKTPAEQASRAQLMIGVGGLVAIFGVFRLFAFNNG